MGISLADAKRLGIDHLHPGTGPKAIPATRVAPRSTDAMNKLERRYATDVLEPRRLAGEILRYDYQPIKLRLADNTFYTPDWRVILADGVEEMHECKGFLRDDAAVKIKVAAEQHPYRFVMVRLISGRWKYEAFEGKQR